MIGRSDLPTACLLIVADAVGGGDPLRLLLAIMPSLSKQCRSAAHDSLAALPVVSMVPYHQRVTDAAVRAVAAACPQLRSLSLGSCGNITSRGALFNPFFNLMSIMSS